jgi:enoyl-CoA hydratase/carnithine racemase
MNTSQTKHPAPKGGHIDIETRGPVLVARIDGGPHALFDAALVGQLKALVDRADKDPNIHAVVFTGTHPERFLSHSDLEWLQQGSVGFPPINTTIAGIVTRMARTLNKVPVIRSLARMTRLKGKPFTPAEALALGAVDEVVTKDQVLPRAVERAEYLSLRAKKSIGAIKRSIYFGTTLSLEDGLQLEHAEFLVRDQDREAQRRMLAYIAETNATGELPLMNRATYAHALKVGGISL